MKKRIVILSIGLAGALMSMMPVTTNVGEASNSESNNGYTVDEFYKKIDLDYGTLGEDGRSIDFIFVKTDLDAGRYDIELTDGPGDLYEVKGTDIYMKLNGYFGYAGYGKDCVLKVESYSATVYKIE